MIERCDVVVAGAGPAGAIAAYELARSGLSVVMADRLVSSWPKVGETLPGAAIRLLRQSGLSEIVTELQRVQAPVTGMLIAWNATAFVSNDACNDPYGSGLRVDRASFDAALRQAAQSAGVCLHCAEVTSLQRREGGWSVELDEDRHLVARWLIDATGRRARVARLIGQPRWRGKPLVALYRTGLPEQHRQLSRTIITAGPDGWIYSARCGDDRWVFGYHTTPQQAARLHARSERWNDIIATSAGLSDLLGTVLLDPPIYVHDARTVWLESPMGEGWIAVGDAALAFDPIAGQGLFNALYTSMNAANVIRSVSSGARSPDYTEALAKIAAIYTARRRTLYGQERRWRERPFWQMHGAAV